MKKNERAYAKPGKHVINNHDTERSLIISPGVATRSIRTAALQLVGVEEPVMFETEESAFHGELMRLHRDTASFKPITGYKVMQLVRNPFDRFWGNYLHVVLPEIKHLNNHSVGNLVEHMFGPDRDYSELGIWWYNEHMIPQYYRARGLKLDEITRLEDDGIEVACDWLGIKPVENVKKDRQKMEWRGGKWAGPARETLAKALRCDFKHYGYDPSE